MATGTHHSFVLSDDIFHAARHNQRRMFAREVLEHCESVLPHSFIATPPQDRLSILEAAFDQAKSHGLTKRGPLYVWSEASIVFGGPFMADPLCEAAREAIAGSSETQMVRARRLHHVLLEHVETALGDGGAILLPALGRLEEAFLSGTVPKVSEIASKIWPERATLAGPDAVQAFVDHLESSFQGLGTMDDRNRATLAGCCLFLGAWAWADPLRPWLAKALRHPLDRDENTVLFKVSRKFFLAAKERLEDG
ncbi:MAG: hypothetical protein AAFP28_02725 [Pseudomonadota bacterium]